MFDITEYLDFKLFKWIEQELLLSIKKYYFVLRFLLVTLLFIIAYPISLCTLFTYSNCWIYAVNQYIKFNGYIVFRKTKWNSTSWIIWDHALWSPDLKNFYTFIPKNNKKIKLVPPLLFIGRIIVTDYNENPLKNNA
jgi:hypothetical protein